MRKRQVNHSLCCLHVRLTQAVAFALKVVEQMERTPELPWSLDSADLGEQYILRLFVTGMTTRSAEALANIKSVCDEHLEGRYDLEVVDIYQQPELASDDQIIAAPTLIKKLPEPLRRFIGDLSDRDRVLAGLGLSPKPRPTP